MMNSNYEDIKNYLIGDLGTEEREELERRIIDDEEFGIEALAAEDALIERYVDGELTDTEAELFRSNYLVTDARAQRVKDFVALRSAARGLVESSRLQQTSRGEKTSRWSFSGFFAPLSPAMAVGLLLLAAVTGVGIWIYTSDGQTSALEREFAELNRDDFSDLAKFASYTNVPVTPNTFRSQDGGTKVTMATLTPRVLFRLPLTFDPPPDATFNASVIREGKTTFTVKDQRPVKNGSLSEIRLLLPREVIRKGPNQISLSQTGADVAPVVFQFTVE